MHIRKAHEKARVLRARTESRSEPASGQRRPFSGFLHGSAQPNAYYFYFVDEDFSPSPQFLLVFPVWSQALRQRPRVRQTPADQGGHRLRGARQRHPQLWAVWLLGLDPDRQQKLCQQQPRELRQDPELELD